ncbi:hypothetical protein PROFUN_05838 [Planoprotostelium fungivorum]|uniref:HIT domain-containing protein n=1 Tax=Planoprotostelium fungivorum TaxID=1890364 RepID=A0A2P6NKN7_9EUKA|nr:hypothetical protein PROFUN_05838 [Planoprotostelium fungivorum]
MTESDRPIPFGQYNLDATQVFFRSKYSLGIVNLMPAVPGHVMIIPKRKVERFADMTAEELSDMMISSQIVAKVVTSLWPSTSMNMAIQDGPDSGQTVQHVHLHIMPRRPGDFARNDDIYQEIEKPRVRRSSQEMAEESKMLEAYFPDSKNWSFYSE